MTISRALLVAYRSTRYVARTSRGPVVIRIDERTPDLDRLLAEHAVETWAFVTAWNPRSREVGDAENRRALALLEAWLRRAGYAFHPGEGEPAHSNWTPEPSFLVLGIARDAAIALGREFEQNAIVFGARGAKAGLIDCFPESPGEEPSED